MVEITVIIGLIGVLFGLFVAPPQILKTLKSKDSKGVSVVTYAVLNLAIICYLIRAIAIKEMVFIMSNSIGLIMNSFMLYLIIKYKN